MAVSIERYERLIKWGSCSWNYPQGWAGVVYRDKAPESQLSLFSNRVANSVRDPVTPYGSGADPRTSAELLAEYCRYPLFSTLCLDMTYYRKYSCQELSEFARYLTPHFPTLIKVWNQITNVGNWRKVGHPTASDSGYRRIPNPDFLNPRLFVDHYLPPFDIAFREHAGMFVFEFMRLGRFDHHQMKWRNYDAEKFNLALARFLSVLPTRYRYAVEIRDRNLLNREYGRILKDHGVAHCFNQWESMYSIQEQYDIVGFTADFAAVRWLTPPEVKYAFVQQAYAPYDRIQKRLPAVRNEIVSLVQEALANEVELFVTVNNRAEGHAPGTISELDTVIRNSCWTQGMAA